VSETTHAFVKDYCVNKDQVVTTKKRKGQQDIKATEKDRVYGSRENILGPRGDYTDGTHLLFDMMAPSTLPDATWKKFVPLTGLSLFQVTTYFILGKVWKENNFPLGSENAVHEDCKHWTQNSPPRTCCCCTRTTCCTTTKTKTKVLSLIPRIFLPLQRLSLLRKHMISVNHQLILAVRNRVLRSVGEYVTKGELV
jgi:hypothetical protein